MQPDKVEFENHRFTMDVKGATVDDVRAVLVDIAPAAAHAECQVIDNGDGSRTFRFTAKAGTKG